MPAITSTSEARSTVQAQLPEAINFEAVLKNDLRIGWTYTTGRHTYGWVLTTGRISTVKAITRDRAEHYARATHKEHQ